MHQLTIKRTTQNSSGARPRAGRRCWLSPVAACLGTVPGLAALADPPGRSSYIYDADGNQLVRHDPDSTTLYLPGEELTYNTTTQTVTGTRYYTINGEMARRSTRLPRSTRRPRSLCRRISVRHVESLGGRYRQRALRGVGPGGRR